MEVETGCVATAKVAELAPAAMVTVAGGTTLDEVDETEITMPPAGAGPLNVANPVLDVPPTTEFGLRVKVASPGGVTVSLAVRLCPP